MSYTLNLAIREQREAERARAVRRSESLEERYGRAVDHGYTGSIEEFKALLRAYHKQK